MGLFGFLRFRVLLNETRQPIMMTVHFSASGAAELLPSVGMDLPVDPNEPTYCVCRQVIFSKFIIKRHKDRFALNFLFIALLMVQLNCPKEMIP